MVVFLFHETTLIHRMMKLFVQKYVEFVYARILLIISLLILELFCIEI